jgi:hypothetical protein
MVTKQKGTRAGAGLGLFDVVAIRPRDVRLVQVKAGKTRFVFTDQCRTPVIERRS